MRVLFLPGRGGLIIPKDYLFRSVESNQQIVTSSTATALDFATTDGSFNDVVARGEMGVVGVTFALF